MLNEIFKDIEIPTEEIYREAQIVVKFYMDKTGKKIDYVAQQLGTTAGYLRPILDPNQHSKPLSIDKIIDITKLTGDDRIIKKIAHKLDGVFVRKLKVGATLKDLSSLCDEVMIEDNELFLSIKTGTADGDFDLDETNISLKELDDADQRHAELRLRLNAHKAILLKKAV